MTPLLQVEGIAKMYGARIGCTDVSFDLYPGEVMGIVGESGCGKTVLARSIMRLNLGSNVTTTGTAQGICSPTPGPSVSTPAPRACAIRSR